MSLLSIEDTESFYGGAKGRSATMVEICSPSKIAGLTIALEVTSASTTMGTYSRIMERTTPHSLSRSVTRATKTEVLPLFLTAICRL